MRDSLKPVLRAVAAVLTCLAVASTPAIAEEGMWTFDNFPTARMQRDMDWAPDQAWLNRVMVGTARLPGCSGSVVSAEGLVLTNHHCAIACIRALSSAQANYLDAGFMARERSQERRCPGWTISVLQSITDVTPAIETATTGAANFAQARDAEFARQRADCPRGLSCEVVTLYQGGRYALYRYKRYDDVRLVFAPEHVIAQFGGEADNFNFPRYCLDVALLRLYDSGSAARTPQHLRMRWTPIQDGEVALVAGNPGATSRLLTTSELVFQRDVVLPWRLASLRDARERLIAFIAQSPDNARVAAEELQTTENSLKLFEGRRAALMDPAGFAHVAAAETDLQARVRRNAAAIREVGDAWGEIGRAQAVYRGFFYKYQYLEVSAGSGSDLFAWARDLVRAAAERPKPDDARLWRYTDARIGIVERSIRADHEIDRGFEQLNLEVWLTGMRLRLPPNDAAGQRIFAGRTPAALAAALAQSHLDDPAVRRALWEGGAEAIAASDDPMIVFVRAWDADARAVRTRYVNTVETPVSLAQEKIARVRFRAFGDAHAPDATFSPRISYGRIAGWTEPGGAPVPATTLLSGLYERANDATPLPRRWIEVRPRLDGATIYNVASSNDIIGGNSGSPLLDREGRVIGTAFDGNLHSLGGEYFYDGAVNRTVSVASSAIREALTTVYVLPDLVAEMDAR